MLVNLINLFSFLYFIQCCILYPTKSTVSLRHLNEFITFLAQVVATEDIFIAEDELVISISVTLNLQASFLG